MAGKSDIGWKVVSGLTALGAGIAARKILELAWTKSTGNAPPENPDSPEVAMREAVLWAVATGVTMGLARLFATREAAKAWRRVTGDLPAVFREIKDELD